MYAANRDSVLKNPGDHPILRQFAENPGKKERLLISMHTFIHIHFMNAIFCVNQN